EKRCGAELGHLSRDHLQGSAASFHHIPSPRPVNMNINEPGNCCFLPCSNLGAPGGQAHAAPRPDCLDDVVANQNPCVADFRGRGQSLSRMDKDSWHRCATS